MREIQEIFKECVKDAMMNVSVFRTNWEKMSYNLHYLEQEHLTIHDYQEHFQLLDDSFTM